MTPRNKARRNNAPSKVMELNWRYEYITIMSLKLLLVPGTRIDIDSCPWLRLQNIEWCSKWRDNLSRLWDYGKVDCPAIFIGGL